jgi:hypothetical protein
MMWLERFEAMERERARVLDKLNDASWQRHQYELLTKERLYRDKR